LIEEGAIVMADQVAKQILADGDGLDRLCCMPNGRILREGADTGLRVNAFGEIREDPAAPVLAIKRSDFVISPDGEWLGRVNQAPLSEK
jgi:hypothetical protein